MSNKLCRSFTMPMIAAVLLGAAVPVSAGLVYNWVSTDGSTGLLELDDSIALGDTFVVKASVIDNGVPATRFEFSAGSFSFSDPALLRPTNITWQAESFGLCAPNCTNHGGAATKSTDDPSWITMAANQGQPATSPSAWQYSIGLEINPVIVGTGHWALVPLPAAGPLMLSAIGLGGLGKLARRFRRKQA